MSFSGLAGFVGSLRGGVDWPPRSALLVACKKKSPISGRSRVYSWLHPMNLESLIANMNSKFAKKIMCKKQGLPAGTSEGVSSPWPVKPIRTCEVKLNSSPRYLGRNDNSTWGYNWAYLTMLCKLRKIKENSFFVKVSWFYLQMASFKLLNLWKVHELTNSFSNVPTLNSEIRLLHTNFSAFDTI